MQIPLNFKARAIQNLQRNRNYVIIIIETVKN